MPSPAALPDQKLLQEVADLVNVCKRPVLYFGGGVISAGASEELLALARKAQIPACHTLMGTGVIGFGDQLDLGMIGMHGSVTANAAIDSADLVLAVGSRFSDRVALKSDAFAPRAKIVHMDIDPSEFDKNVICDLAVSGDLKAALASLLPLIEERDRSDWQAEIDSWRAADATLAQRRSGFFPQVIMEIIGEEAGSDAVVVTDVGQHQMWAAQFCKQTHPRGFLTSGGLGTMGFGLGAAIGAKLALGETVTVVHITGDASFHMNMQETCTAVSEGLQIITVLMDNKTLGMVRQLQHYFQGSRYIATEPDRKTDFVMLENAFGGTGFHAENADEFRTALRKAMKTAGPSLIHCPISHEELVLPMIASGKTVSDIILDA